MKGPGRALRFDVPDGTTTPDPSLEAPGDASGDAAEVVFYWRPGCPFCSMLRAGLRRTGLQVREVDIWEHPEGAAFVRSVANGNETVPTVAVGRAALVNPSADEVLRLVAEHAPALLPEGVDPDARRRWFRR